MQTKVYPIIIFTILDKIFVGIVLKVIHATHQIFIVIVFYNPFGFIRYKHTKLVTKHYNKYQRDPNTYKRYSNRWLRIRQLYIKEHPVRELCERKNILKAVEEVHHIIPLSKGGTHNEENLMSLCKSCHSRLTATEGGRWG